MKIGTSKEQRDSLRGNKFLDDQIELKEGSNLHRVIQGPQKIRTFFIPTVEEEDGVMKASWSAINYIDTGSIIDTLVSIEEDIREQMGQKVRRVKGQKNQDLIDCGFKPSLKFFYQALDMKNKADFRIRPVKYPKTVVDDIDKIETTLDPLDEQCLANGLMWMYDLLITKTIDPKKSKRFGTSYKASIYGNNQFQGIVPAKWLNEDAGEIIFPL